MSMRSMTGYGRGEVSADGVQVTVELSSVNRRQLDVQVSLPRALNPLESRIYDAVRKIVTRGRVTGEVIVTWSSRRKSGAIQVDEQLAANYLKVLRRTARSLALPDNFDANLLLSLPNVVTFREMNGNAGKLWPLVNKAVQSALREMVRMKSREGAALQKDLLERLDLLAEQLGRIRKRAPAVVKAYRRGLKKRIEEAGFDLAQTDERLLREIVFFADRSDIAEETTRLESHLAQARKVMRGKPPTGKALDFLAQEMLREINTIGSKANDASILRHVVTFKAELERIREQIQNIE